MTAAELLTYVRRQGGQVWLEGKHVRVSAAKGALGEDVWTALTEAKQAVRELLEREAEEVTPPPQVQSRPRIPPRLPDTPLRGLFSQSATGSAAAPVELTRGIFARESIVESFARTMAVDPGAAAARYEGRTLSYAELDELAGRVAASLWTRGIRRGDIVALSMERGLAMIATMLGILKVGGAYLPVEAGYPASRIAAMLEDCGTRIVVVDGTSLRDVPPGVGEVEFAEITAEPGAFPAPTLCGEDLACVLYTSGSTGRPKGVCIPHRGIVRLVRGTDYVDFGRGDVVAQMASISFDAASFEIWGALLNGGLCVVLSQDVVLSPLSLAEALEREKVDMLFLTTALFTIVAREAPGAFAKVRDVLSGGEAMDAGAARSVLRYEPPRRLVNIYGPTENSTFSCFHELRAVSAAEESIPIGRTIAHSTTMVLDADLNPVPAGVTGELYVGGEGLAWGYYKRPGLTAERFIANPSSTLPGAVMYRTGDLVQLSADGILQFVGRTDHQVKIRGLRIELGEIEAALRSHPSVEDALVSVHQPGAEKQLLAYVVVGLDDHQQHEAEQSHVSEWHELYETVYGEVVASPGDFNLAGWRSSYTGAPIAADEMRIWIDQTVARLRSIPTRDVVEVGCGTGLLLTRLAESCRSYTGVDFSESVLRTLGSYVGSRKDLAHVRLRHGLAHDLSFLPDASTDLLILNSIVQYFPHAGYLLDVLREALRVTRDGGRIFVGDVRNLAMLKAYHASVQLFQAEATTTPAELKRRVLDAQRADKELLLDPKLFVEFARSEPRAGSADVALKAGAYDNELSRFRYDVTISVGQKKALAAPQQWIRWDAEGVWREELASRWHSGTGDATGVRGIPDGRVAGAVYAADVITDAGATFTSAGDLVKVCETKYGEDPDAVFTLAQSLGTTVAWGRFRSDGLYDVIFGPRWVPATAKAPLPRSFYDAFTNAPARMLADAELSQTLRTHLKSSLPEYMVPPKIFPLAAWPLNTNGKIDRSALPVPGRTGRANAAYDPPRSETEAVLAGIWQSILEVERVGRGDHFFALGGHSLRATRVMSRVRDVFGVELRVRTLFDAPRLKDLGRAIEQARLQGTSRRPVLGAQPRPALLPLSYAQQRLWFVDRLQGESGEYNMPEALRLQGSLDREALRRALQTIVDRHESLRTHFAEVDGQPIQIVAPSLPALLPEEDLRELDEPLRDLAVEAAMRREGLQEFDLRHGPVVRFRLLTLGEQEHILLRTFHHITSDGWSEWVFRREFEALYAAYREGLDNPLQPMPLQYADFTLWQRECLAGEALDRELAFWKTELNGAPPVLELPTDRPRPAKPSYEAGAFSVEITAQLKQALDSLSQKESASLYMTLLAGFAVVIEGCTGQGDLVIGTPVANRQDSRLEELIGMFVNTLVMRVKVDRQQSFRELLAAVRRMTLDAYQHQDLPFERLVEELAPERRLNTTPVFQVSFAVQNAPSARQNLRGLALTSIGRIEHRVRYDLELHWLEAEESLKLVMLYKTALFDAWRIEQMAARYLQVLERAAEEAEIGVRGLVRLSDGERQLMLEGGQGESAQLSPLTVVDLFARQVERCGSNTAVVFGDTSLSYGELDAASDSVATRLAEIGIGPEKFVGLLVERGPGMLVSLLGILKAGAAYVPLDPQYPAVRLRDMMGGLTAVVTSSVFYDQVPAALTALVWDETGNAASTVAQAIQRPRPENAAYMIYTSGSTGRPKGVVVDHRSLANHMIWMAETYPLSGEDRVLGRTSISFDAAIWELLHSLLSGATLEMVSSEMSRDPGALCQHMDRVGVTVAQFVPTLLNAVCAPGTERPRALRAVFCGGEALPAELARRVRERWKLGVVNLYGPTETTIQVSHFRCEEAPDTAEVPIGRPILNAQLYVLDAELDAVPVGFDGDLYISGDSLARGYNGAPAMTAERFVANPFEPGARMYRTGDKARWRPDGILEFRGRADAQLKLRGFRIEPGEIEETLRRMPDVADAVVGLRTQPGRADAPAQLVSWIVPAPGCTIDAAVLRVGLLEKLPQHLVPSIFAVLESLPLMPNGKVDRRSLPEPAESDAVSRPPSSREEEVICGIFAEVLALSQVKVNDNFFALGGHSLLVTKVVSRIRAVLRVELSIRAFWEAPTVEELALRCRAEKQSPAVSYANPKTVVRRKMSHAG